MGPTFDPAVAKVLEAFGRRLASGSTAARAEAVLADASLANDGPRAREILQQLVADGLLEQRDSGVESTSGTYSLTALGQARIEQQHRNDED